MKKILCLLLVVASLVTNYSQVMVYTNDFENGPPFDGWDIENYSTNPKTGKYLGKIINNEVGNQQAVLSLDGMPDHSYVTVEFDFFIFGTWDGNGRSYDDELLNQSPLWADPGCPDLFKVTAEGMTLVHTSFSNHDLNYYRYQSYPGTYPQDSYRAGTGASEINTLGMDWNLDWYKNKAADAILIKDATYHFKLTFPSISAWTDIVFQTFNTDSTFNGSDWIYNTDEWWGIDNISVIVSDEPISPVTIVTPLAHTKMVPNAKNTGATIYTWGEAGTFLSIQSATDLGKGNSVNGGVDGGFVNLNSVSFNGYHKYNTTFRTTTGLQNVETESTRPTPVGKFFRAKFSK
jgi:hypothetical protein